MELAALFIVAFLSATFVPLQSEIVLILMVQANDHPAALLLAVASIANTLGALVNWWLGRGIKRFESRRWFPVKRPALARAERWFTRWGKWSLLLSWLPIAGDALTVMAGVLRMRFFEFLAIVAIAKTGRYLMLIWLI